jgi:hypothetical protein
MGPRASSWIRIVAAVAGLAMNLDAERIEIHVDDRGDAGTTQFDLITLAGAATYVAMTPESAVTGGES